MMQLGNQRTIRWGAACALPLLSLLLTYTAGCPPIASTAEAAITPDPIPADYSAPEDDQEVVECWHHELGDQGAWENQEPYGEVWEPPVTEGWRPYTEGHWEDTDQGWGWVDDEPWGWAVFHYGRWAYGPKHRWFWVPGSRWAPAWVAWRSGGGYVGWAPLPPVIGFADGRGLDPGTGSIDATHFTFVAESSMLSHDLRHALLPLPQGSALLAKTADVTRYQVKNHRILDVGVDRRGIAAATGQPLQRVKVAGLTAGTGIARGAFYQPPALAQRRVGGSRREFGSASPAHLAQPARFSALPSARLTHPQRAEAAGSRRASARTAAGWRTSRVAAGPRSPHPSFQGQTRSSSAAGMASSASLRARALQPTRHQGNAFQPRSFQSSQRQAAARQPARFQTQPAAPAPNRFQPQQTARFQPAAPSPQFQRSAPPPMPRPAQRMGGGTPSGGYHRPPA
jgi:hypothetical protein